MFVIPGLYYNIILRMHQLKEYQHKIKKNFKLISFNSDTCCSHCLKLNKCFSITLFSCQCLQKMLTLVLASKTFFSICNILISIGTITFQHLVSKPNHEIYTVFFKNIEQALKSKVRTKPVTALPEPYKEFLKVFSQ